MSPNSRLYRRRNLPERVATCPIVPSYGAIQERPYLFGAKAFPGRAIARFLRRFHNAKRAPITSLNRPTAAVIFNFQVWRLPEIGHSRDCILNWHLAMAEIFGITVN